MINLIGRASSTLTHQSFYYLQYKFIYVHESVSRLLLKAGCSNLFLSRWWLCQELQSKSVCNNHRLLLGGRHCLLDSHHKWCTRDWVARSFFFLGKVGTRLVFSRFFDIRGFVHWLKKSDYSSLGRYMNCFDWVWGLFLKHFKIVIIPHFLFSLLFQLSNLRTSFHWLLTSLSIKVI